MPPLTKAARRILRGAQNLIQAGHCKHALASRDRTHEGAVAPGDPQAKFFCPRGAVIAAALKVPGSTELDEAIAVGYLQRVTPGGYIGLYVDRDSTTDAEVQQLFHDALREAKG